MALVEIPIKTTTPFFDSLGNPLVGVKITFQLDRNDYDVAGASFVYAGIESCVALDATGMLPALSLALWPNDRGQTGSRWLIGVKQDKTYIIKPVAVYIKTPVGPATDWELTTLLNTAVPPAWLAPR